MKLYSFQENVLNITSDKNKVAYYLDMGLGKTFVGAEKMKQLNTRVNLIICQKSKINDWIEHLVNYYLSDYLIFDLTDKNEIRKFLLDEKKSPYKHTGVINYELAFRRQELSNIENFTLMLDESSLIQNENAKRSKFILKKMKPKNVILLSGTPTGGKYEKLWSQMHLLGWKISKELYWKQFVDVEYMDNEGFPIKIVKGYKNVDRLKQKMRDYGCVFMKTDDVFDLPEQTFQRIMIDTTSEYKKFHKSGIVMIGDIELVGDTTLNKMLYERQLCGNLNPNKLKALKDILESTDDRLIIFYNFNNELRDIEDICIELDKPLSIVNGQIKDLSCYEEYENSVTAIQYQAGAMGLNLQKSNKIIYFTPCLSSEAFEQSKKRTHRIGQKLNCFYYELICKNSIDERIYNALELRKDYTDKLFEEEI